MKIILIGATGFVGSEILEQLIAHNYIERIFCLTRTPLDGKYFKMKKATDKVVEIIHENFGEYPASLLRRLRAEGAEGCIWALGSPKMERYKNIDEARRVGVHYPMQAAQAFAIELASALSPQEMPKKKFPFRFVFISGWGAEHDQFRNLWVYNDSRKIKGAAEKGIFEIADNSAEVQGHRCFEAIALRAGSVMPAGDAIGTIMWEATSPSIAVDRLAKCAIKQAMMGTGDEKKRVLENRECLGDDWAQFRHAMIPAAAADRAL